MFRLVYFHNEVTLSLIRIFTLDIDQLFLEK